MKKYKVVLAGTGWIANKHAKGLKENADRLELAAVADVNPGNLRKFCEEHGVSRSYGTLAEMLRAEKPDVVDICTPPQFHAALAIESMEAGAHALCEKPLCGSLADLERIMAAEKRTGRYCASVFQWRYGAGTRHLKALMSERVLGDPLIAVCNTLWYRNAAYYEVPWRGKWENELGGPTIGHGIHAMDFLLDIMGPWKSVRAIAATLDHKIEVEDVSMALVHFENGCRASIVNSVVSPRQESHVRFDFQKATVELKHLYRYENDDWTFTPLEGMPEEARARIRAIGEGSAADHGAQLKALVEDLDHSRRPSTSGEGVRPIIELITGIYKSAATGKVIERGSIKAGDPFHERFNGGMKIAHAPRTMDAGR